MIVIVRLAFIAALLGAPMAAAQDWAPTAASVGPETAAAASAEADALIAGSGAPEFFENVSEGLPRVRHRASGLVCTFLLGGAGNRLVVFESGSVPRGDDVGCSGNFDTLTLSYYAMRYGGDYSALDSARDAAAAIRDRNNDARPIEGASDRITPPGSVVEMEYAGFLIGAEDAPRYTHVLTAQVGEWVFKQRATGDGAGEALTDSRNMSAMMFNDVVVAAVAAGKPR